jgi:prophage maintenance system killer protein
MNAIEIYKTKDGQTQIEVKFEEETVWLTQAQIVSLFQSSKANISEHIKHIFKSGELSIDPTVRKFRTIRKEGKRFVRRELEYYNLDMIITVGYRVNSKRGTQFRIWATQRLKDFLIKGYSINEKLLKEQNARFKELKETVKFISRIAKNSKLTTVEATGLIEVISGYSGALDLLDEYDYQKIKSVKKSKQKVKRITYNDVLKVVNGLRKKFNASSLFGREKDNSFKSAIETIYQTFNKKELYPGIETKASMLLYLIIKNHAFIDGNKRIAAAVFIWFLALNNFLYHKDGSKRLADNTLVAICIMVAQSNPKEKDLIVKLLIRLLTD